MNWHPYKPWSWFCLMAGLGNIILFTVFRANACFMVGIAGLAIGYLGLHE